MTDIVASLGLEVKTGGFSDALKQVQSFVDKAGAASDKAKNLNSALAELGRTMQAFSTQTMGLKSAGDELNKVVTSGTTRWTSQAKALEKVAEAQKKVAQGQKETRGTAHGGGSGSSGGSSGWHSFVSASASGLHVGMIGQLHPAIGATMMAAEAAIGPVKSLFDVVADGAKASLQAAMQMDQVRATLSVIGGKGGVASELEYLRQVTERLALPIVETSQAYAKLSAAAGGSVTAQQAAKVAFEGVATASRALHLSAGDTSGAIKALVDMFSKGQVMSEELKRQLGNRVPGAMRIAGEVAMQMGLDLNTALTKGLLKGDKAYEFIKLFGRALQDEFGGAALDAAGNLASALVRLQNASITLGDAISKSGLQAFVSGTVKGVADGIRVVTEAVEAFAKTEAGKQLFNDLEATGQLVGQMISDFAAWSVEFAGAAGFAGELHDAVTGLIPMFTFLFEGMKSFALNMAGVAKLSRGEIKEGLRMLQESAAIQFNIGKTVEENTIKFVANRLMNQMNRGFDEKTGEAPGKAAKPLPPPPDKDALKLAEQQDKFIAGLRSEVLVAQNLDDRLGLIQNKYRRLIDLKLVYINTQGEVEARGRKGQEAIGLVNDLESAKELKKLWEEGNKAALAMDKAQSDLATKVQARYTLESMFPDMYAQNRNYLSQMVEKGMAWIDQERGQLVFLNERAELTAKQVLMQDKLAAAAAAESDALDKSNKVRDQAIKHISQTYDKRAGGREWAAREMFALHEWSGEKGGLAALNPDQLKVYYGALLEIKMKTDESFRAVADTITKAMDRAGEAVFDFATKQINSWADVRDGVRSMVSDILKEIVRMMIKLMIIQPMMESFKTGTGMSWIGTIARFFGGGKASGGPVAPGTSYMVGERGPERFVPSVPGTILPNGASLGGINVPIVVNVDNRGNETAGASVQQGGGDLAAGIRRVVIEEIRQQSRTSGHLWKMQHGMVGG